MRAEPPFSATKALAKRAASYAYPDLHLAPATMRLVIKCAAVGRRLPITLFYD